MPEYAEKVNYWQTSRASPDTWLERAANEIRKAGGDVIREGYVREPLRSAYMLNFDLDGEEFLMVWPVLVPKGPRLMPARIQAATALYHEVKAACVKAKFLGTRAAFFAYLVLPDGRTASQVASHELSLMVPPILLGTQSERSDAE